MALETRFFQISIRPSLTAPAVFDLTKGATIHGNSSKLPGAAGGVLADQWKDIFTVTHCGGGSRRIKGEKRTSSRSSNRKGTDNVITSGSVIAVADGQCMMIVEQGKVVELCADPGEFVFDASTEPSLFAAS